MVADDAPAISSRFAANVSRELAVALGLLRREAGSLVMRRELSCGKEHRHLRTDVRPNVFGSGIDFGHKFASSIDNGDEVLKIVTAKNNRSPRSRRRLQIL